MRGELRGTADIVDDISFRGFSLVSRSRTKRQYLFFEKLVFQKPKKKKKMI